MYFQDIFLLFVPQDIWQEPTLLIANNPSASPGITEQKKTRATAGKATQATGFDRC